MDLNKMNEKELRRFIITYLEKKAEEIKPFYPYYYVRLNEIQSELKTIFNKLEGLSNVIKIK